VLIYPLLGSAHVFWKNFEHNLNSQQATHPARRGGRTKLALVKKNGTARRPAGPTLLLVSGGVFCHCGFRETGPNFWCWL